MKDYSQAAIADGGNKAEVTSHQDQALMQFPITNPELSPVVTNAPYIPQISVPAGTKTPSRVRAISSLRKSITPVVKRSALVAAAPIGHLDRNETMQAIIQRGHEKGPDQRNVYTNKFQRPGVPVTASPVLGITSSAPVVTMASLLPTATVSGSNVPVSVSSGLAGTSPHVGTAAPISVTTVPNNFGNSTVKDYLQATVTDVDSSLKVCRISPRIIHATPND